jgi:hypothetical protein
VQWKFIGNPSENINKIIGVNFANRKLYVLTASGNTYSIYFNYPPDVISNPIRWNQEKYNNILVDPVEEFGGKMFKPPPPPFKLKQIYQFEIPTTESNNPHSAPISSGF